jgi:hypothetical protein
LWTLCYRTNYYQIYGTKVSFLFVFYHLNSF